ncbi:hypothetical protein B0H16DRAFT_1453273 [Mycena metata]|uniref:Uncharacterized protein n=1 Tax=Mycena metata TaxID=1033252 RepID=A0AAD7JP74_9AGAR|nr:hypothetical protein B0H16DRAFT_1453273 [Mycena metata]
MFAGPGGTSHYNEQLKYLFRLLKALPEVIPLGDAHNFVGYPRSSSKLAASNLRTPAGETIIIQFKSRGPGLEEVVTVLTMAPFRTTPVPLSKLFAMEDLLADVPVVGANEIRSLADWSGEVSVGVSRPGKAAGKKAWDGEAEKIAF